LRKEQGGEFVRGLLIQDKKAPEQKDITINVLRSNKTWGSYRHSRLSQPEAEMIPTAHVCQRYI